MLVVCVHVVLVSKVCLGRMEGKCNFVHVRSQTSELLPCHAALGLGLWGAALACRPLHIPGWGEGDLQGVPAPCCHHPTLPMLPTSATIETVSLQPIATWCSQTLGWPWARTPLSAEPIQGFDDFFGMGDTTAKEIDRVIGQVPVQAVRRRAGFG